MMTTFARWFFLRVLAIYTQYWNSVPLLCCFSCVIYVYDAISTKVRARGKRTMFFKPSFELPLFLSIFLSLFHHHHRQASAAAAAAQAQAVAIWFSYWNSGFLLAIHLYSCVRLHFATFFIFFFFCFSSVSSFLVHFHRASSSSYFFSSVFSSSTVGRFDEPLFHREPFSVDKNLALLEWRCVQAFLCMCFARYNFVLCFGEKQYFLHLVCVQCDEEWARAREAPPNATTTTTTAMLRRGNFLPSSIVVCSCDVNSEKPFQLSFSVCIIMVLVLV